MSLDPRAGSTPNPPVARSSVFSNVDPATTGRLLLALSLLGFALGGLEALALRVQLSRADAHVMAAST